MENKNVNIQFPGFFTLLGIVFIILKLCNVIDWAWIWVLAPIWMSWGLVAVILIFSLIITLIALIIGWIATR